MNEECGLVSFLVPTYNRGYCIARTLESILSQTYHNVELLVIDDGSDDDTTEVVAGIGDNRIKYFRYDQNLGHPVRMKEGMQHASGRYFVFMGSDDYLAHNTVLESVINVFERLPPDVWNVTLPIQCEKSEQLAIDFRARIVDFREYLLDVSPLSSLDVLHFYRGEFLKEFLACYSEPYEFYTAFREVYLRTHCRIQLLPALAAIAGFSGDNVTKGAGGAKYERWAEQAALRTFLMFEDKESFHRSDWWKTRLKRAIYYSLAGRCWSRKKRMEVLVRAVNSYKQDFGVSPSLLFLIVSSSLPFGIPAKLRFIRDRFFRTKRQ